MPAVALLVDGVLPWLPDYAKVSIMYEIFMPNRMTIFQSSCKYPAFVSEISAVLLSAFNFDIVWAQFRHTLPRSKH